MVDDGATEISPHVHKTRFSFVTLIVCILLGSTVAPTSAQAELDLSIAKSLSSHALNEERKFLDQLKNRDRMIVLFEGDSWFDLPWTHTDLVDVFRHCGYTVISEAKRGDTLENMAYSNQLSDMVVQLRR